MPEYVQVAGKRANAWSVALKAREDQQLQQKFHFWWSRLNSNTVLLECGTLVDLSLRSTYILSKGKDRVIHKWCHGLRGRGQGFCYDNTKVLVIKSVTMGRGAKFTCIFLKDPLTRALILLIYDDSWDVNLKLQIVCRMRRRYSSVSSSRLHRLWPNSTRYGKKKFFNSFWLNFIFQKTSKPVLP